MRVRNISTFFILFVILISQLHAQDAMYWVGGSGDWNDRNNWSAISGGIGGGAGATIPNTQINAIFDQFSFDAPGQVVTLNGTGIQAFCEDMDWTAVTNTPTFRITDPLNTIDIAGSLRLSPDMILEVQSTFNFTASTPGHFIQSSGHQFSGDIVFDGFNGEWTLVDQLDVTGVITMNTGSLVSNNQNIFAVSFIANSGLAVDIDLGTSNLVLFGTNIKPGQLIFDGDFITLTADQSNIAILGDRGEIVLNAVMRFSFGTIEFVTEEASLITTNIPGQLLPFIDELRFSGNGSIQGDHVILTLSLTNARTVFLEGGSTQFIDALEASGTSCSGDAGLMAKIGSQERATIDFGLRNSFVGPFNLRGIEGISRGGSIIMTDGIDSGNNSSNFIFTEPNARVLYWVGDSGDWDDTNNWALSSGGPGGACLPRSVDDVVFDNASFPSGNLNPQVTSNVPIFINSFTFTKAAGSGRVPSITIPSLYITEDMTITEEVIWQINDVYLIGKDVGGNTTNTDNQNIDVIAGIIRNLIVRGDLGSKVRLANNLSVRDTLDIGGLGSFQSLGHDLTARIIIATNAPIAITLDSSTVRVTGSFDGIDNYPLTIGNITSFSGIATQWVFPAENSGFNIDRATTFGSVTFSSPTGRSSMLVGDNVGIRTLDIMNDGEFMGATYVIDSLIFHPGPSRIYVLNAGIDISVSEYFEGLNDLCNDLTFTTPGTIESISLAEDIDLQLSFITINNIRALGGADYFAGEGSAGIGNVSGWRFATESDELEARQFLGNDILACADSMITLGTPDQLTNVIWRVNGVDVANGPNYTLTGNETEIIAIAETMTGCPTSDTINVALAQPIPSIDLGLDRDLCQGASEILDPGFSDASAEYLWNTGETSETITVNTTDNYSVVVSRSGCVQTANVSITRIDLEPFNLGNDTTLCQSDTYSIPDPGFARPTTSFVWNNGNTSGPLEISEATLPIDNFYFIEVSEGACTDRDSIMVSFDPAITEVFTRTGDTTLCEGDSFELSVVGGFDSLLWNTGSTEETISISTEDTYMVEVYRGVCTSTETRVVAVSRIADFDLGAPVTICENETLQIIKPSNINLPISWIEASTESLLSTDDTLDVALIPGLTTDYILEAQEGICTKRDTVSVTVEVSPTIDLGQDTTICQGASITLSLPSDLDNFEWSNGVSSLINTISTREQISVIADRGRCSVFDTIDIAVLDLTALDIGPADTILCQGEALMLDATLPGSVDYSWSPANAGPIFNVFTADEYSVTVSASGCSVSDTITVSFDIPANFDLHQVQGVQDTTICAGDALTYNFNIANATYLWQNINGDELSTNGSYNISEAGGYTLAVEVGACTTSDTIILAIQEIPILNLQDSIVVCEGDTVALDASINNGTYLWNTTETTGVINITLPGTYLVTATANDCPVSDTTYAVFNTLPDASLPLDEIVCDGDSIILSLSNPGSTYSWINPNGGSTSNTVIANSQGAYIVNVTNEDNCIATDTFSLVVNPTPFFELPDSTSLCDGNVTTLMVNASSMPSRYRWSTADGNPSIEVRNEGQYYVDAFISTNNIECKWSDTTYVTVQPIPTVSLGEDKLICSDSLLYLDATTDGATYIWSTNETTSTIEVSAAGMYEVTVDVKGCTSSDEVEVATIPIPVITLGMDTTICAGDMITLSVGNATGNITWSTGVSGSSIEVTDEDIYSVRIVENGCDAEAEVFIAVADIPVFDLGDNISICDQIGVSLSVSIPDVTVLWSTGDNGSSINVNQTGLYSAVATTSEGCTFEDEIDISQRECSRFEVYRPNVFSPGAVSSANNALFKVTPAETAIISSYSIKIFNRWGNLMYTSSDFNSGWSGRSNETGGKMANPGVYTYIIEVTYSDDFDTNRTDVLHGTVTLIN